MGNNVDETNANYISKISLRGTTYTIRDEWARAEINEIESLIAGGVHFRGVSTTPIADGDAVKDLTVNGDTYAAADQIDGDIFIYVDDGKNLEFIVSDGKYSELGSTGVLGALAFKSSAAGSVEVPLNTAITLDNYTPQVGKGTLAVTTTEQAINVSTTAATATGTFSPAAVTIPAIGVNVTTTKGTFTALASVTYDVTHAILTIDDATSDEYIKTLQATTPTQTVTPDAQQSISVTYDKSNTFSVTVLASAALEGDVLVTPAAPTATITNPTITVTVE